MDGTHMDGTHMAATSSESPPPARTLVAQERRLYSSDGGGVVSVDALLTRMLRQRPLVFMDANDQYVLKTGERGVGAALFPRIGTPEEEPPLTLDAYLSYDEMALAALLRWWHASPHAEPPPHPGLCAAGSSPSCAVSSAVRSVAVPTFLINDGARDNRGRIGVAGSFEEHAVIVDQVGCRFERSELMEVASPQHEPRPEPQPQPEPST
jgi:hypothetical protein